MSENKCLMTLYIFFKSIGLAPFAVENDKKLRVYKSNKGNIYNCILIFFGLYLSLIAYQKYMNSEFPSRSDLGANLIFTKVLIGNFTLLYLWTAMCLKQDTIIRIYHKLIDIDELGSKRLKYMTFDDPVSNIVIMYFGINTLLWIGIMITDKLRFDTIFNLIWLILALPRFIESWFIIQYGFVANLQRKRFQKLNNSFQCLANSVRAFDEVRITDNFHYLKDLYNLLYEMTQKLSEFYSFPILIMITHFCGAIVYTTFYCVQPLIYYSKNYTYLSSINSITWLSMEMFPLIVLTVNITRLTNEMRMVTSIVNKLINRCIDSQVLLTEMKRFSMTLLTRNDQFTAYNFFPIDCTLLHSIISTTATYLIILFQFQDNSNDDDSIDLQNSTKKIDE